MWIIPKTLSAFVPDTEGLNLALDEQAWMLEQSLMWRSKPSAAPTWLRRLKKGGWITHLSGRILKPSLHESFVEKFVAALVDIPVSHFRQQASDKEKKTQDTYGHTSSSTSGQLDLFGAFGKMSQDTPRWGYGESCPIWKKKVTELRQAYSVRKKLAHHTRGNESSSWPTAQTSDSNGAADPTRKAHRTQLRDVETGHLPQGKNWATPMAGTKDHMGSSVEYYQRRQRIGKQVDLNGQVILDKWATPQASDHIEGARTAKESNQKCLGRDLNQMNWATPNTMDHLPPKTGEALARNKKKGGCKNLREDVNNPKMNWPTPRTCGGSRPNGKGGKILDEEVKIEAGIRERGKILAEEAKIHNGLQDQEKSNTSGKNQGSPKLNPNWVESLMLGRGMTGWTQLPTEWIVSDSWGMELSPKPQN